MRITFSLEESELVEAITNISRKKRNKEALRFSGLSALVLVCTAFMGFTYIIEGRIDLEAFVFLVGPLALIQLLYILLTLRPMTWMVRKGVKRSFSSIPPKQRDKEVIANEDGLSSRDEYVGWVCRWEGFSNYIETRSLFLLFLAGGQVSILPKRAFGNESEVQAFREQLASRIGVVYPATRLGT